MIALAFDEVAFPLVLAAKDARLVREAVEGVAARLPFLEALRNSTIARSSWDTATGTWPPYTTRLAPQEAEPACAPPA